MAPALPEPAVRLNPLASRLICSAKPTACCWRATRRPRSWSTSHLDIIQAKGHTGPFLELPIGKASLNLLKMARPGLLFELQNAIEEAGKTGVDALRSNVQVETNGGNNAGRPSRDPFQDAHAGKELLPGGVRNP